jgi:hypothetical protein
MSPSKLALFTVIVSPLERQSPRCAIEGTREAKLLTIWTAESRDIPTRYDELDEDRLKSLVQALRGRAGKYKDERAQSESRWPHDLSHKSDVAPVALRLCCLPTSKPFSPAQGRKINPRRNLSRHYPTASKPNLQE